MESEKQNMNKEQKQTKYREQTEVCQREVGGGTGEIGEGNKELQTSSHNINKSQR